MKFAVIDTEATKYRNRDSQDVDGRDMLTYDFGYVVADTDGVVYERRSIVIAETFADDDLMTSAYYADKLPQYYAGIETGEWTALSFRDAMRLFTQDCKAHGVKRAYAYNARFDRDTLNATTEYYSNGYKRTFLPYGVEWFDIMDMCRRTFAGTKKYKSWATTNDYLTKTGRARVTAETCYRYITNNLDFIERHTALSDAEIELSLLLKARAYRRKHPAPLRLGIPWEEPVTVE